jgi:peptide/nickel transport system substrate-binding protein
MRKTLWLGAVTLGLTLMAAGCTSGATQPKSAAASGTLTVQAPNSPPTFVDNFNPFTGEAPGLNIIYEPLVASNRAKGGQLVPWLAESWTWSADGRTATFKLRPGVKFSDGSPLTAEDVQWTYELRLKNPKVGGAPYSAVAITGKDTVAVTWKEPAYQQLGDLQDIPIVRQQLWASRNPLTYVDKSPVGTGPFKLAKFSPQGVTMTDRTDYWGGAFQVQNLKYAAATSANIQTQLQNGSIDFCTCDVDAKSYVAGDPGKRKFIMAWDGAVVSVLLNNGKAPFDDVNVRRAFALAVDNEAVAKLSSSKLPIIQPPASPSGLNHHVYTDWIAPDLSAPRKQDVTAAKQALATAGYTVQNGVLTKAGKQYPVRYVAPSDTPFLKTVAQLVVEQIRQSLGVSVQLVGGPGSNISDAVSKGNYDMAANWMSSGRGIYPAMNQFNGALTAPVGTDASSNQVRFKNAAFDKLLAQMSGTDDEATLKKLGAQAQAIFADQVPTIPLFDSGAAGVANTARWTGWPDPEKPDYLANTGSGTEFITTLKNLEPAG